jgi:hypothetical protein
MWLKPCKSLLPGERRKLLLKPVSCNKLFGQIATTIPTAVSEKEFMED